MPEQRKLVTILFADVTGSTALSEAFDPEDVREIMRRYYEHARATIATHGGTLEKFIGDAVMAIFGLTVAHGDDAERALAAALALRAALDGDPILAPHLKLRIGVTTGEVVGTSDTAVGDFLVTGDAVNVAARLEQAAEPGEILAGERTQALGVGHFEFADVRLVTVKGKSQPLRIFPLIGPRTTPMNVRPPLVGRRQDLVHLSMLWGRALEDERPQLVSILAPAGTGKTRLLEEFLAQIDAAHSARVATAACPPYGQMLAYSPLRSLLRGLIGETLTPEQVAEVFLNAGYAADDATRLAGLILATLGIESGEATEREGIFAAWRLLVEVLSSQAPRIVVFEDLHWASDSLLDLVEYIMHPRTSAPLLVIALARPELLERRTTWGGGRNNFTTLALEPLKATQTSELVDRLAADLPERLRQQIVERSGGNPFFAIELARTVVRHVAAGSAATPATLPDTVHEAVQARIDQLSAGERAALQAAAVAMRAFQPAMLAAVLREPDAATIAVALDGLRRRDLIAPAAGGAYTFRHILFRDVAYGTLARGERVRMHAATAAWLETQAAGHLDEFTELIAHHYREAVLLTRQSAVPLALPVDPAHALGFLERAGELASRAGAFAEAHNHLRSAIAIAPPSEHARLYELLGDSVLWGDTSFGAYRQALDAWRAAGQLDPLTGARLLRKLVIACTRGFVIEPPSYTEIVALQREAEQLAAAAGDADERWRVRVAHLFVVASATDARYAQSPEPISTEAAASLRHDAMAAADYFEARRNWSACSEALDGYCAISMLTGAMDDVLPAIQRRLTIPELSLQERRDALLTLLSWYFREGDYSRGIATMKDAIARLRPGEPNIHLLGGISLAMTVAFLSGEWADVDGFLPILADIWEQVRYDRSAALVSLGDGYFTAMQVALAREDRAATDAALAMFNRLIPDESPFHDLATAFIEDDPLKLPIAPERTIGDGFLQVMFLSERGLIAPAHLIARVLGHPWSIDLYQRVGAIAAALVADDNSQLAAATAAADEHHLVVHAARTRIVLAQRTGDPAPLALARPVLERLGDRQYLRRLREVADTLAR